MANIVPILVIDDDSLVGEALVSILRAQGFRARAYTSARDLLENLPDVACACVISDVFMPDIDGAELLERLIAQKGKTWPVILITAHGQVSLAVALMRAGAADFIQKPVDPEVLLSTVRRCMDSAQLAAALQTLREQAQLKADQLTLREGQVYHALVEGGSNKTIGRDLALSPRTVEIFRARVMKKMGVETVTELIKLGVSTGTAG
jgi:two-component system response regulator FixJ